ncbi:hypothetical protein MMC13_000889 [Lambiella insularis]|nr:hypothetical protein [Lambiella insularis]
MAGSGSEPTVSTVTNIMSAFVTTTTGGPVATFGGQMILTGSCTVPRIAIYELPTGGLLEYPGWSLLSTELVPYLTPCVTSPTVALLPPSATLSSSVTASIISTQLYTLSYALAAPSSSALSTGAKVGIALGVVAGIFFLLLAYIFIRRYRAHRDQAVRNATILRTDVPYSRGSAHTTPVSPYNKRATFISGGTPSMHSVNQTSPVATEPVPELPSPPPPVSPTRNAYWPGNAAVAGVRAPGATSPGQMGSAAGSRVGSPGSQASGAMEPVMELPGSTFLHEHHPMYLGPEAKGEPAGGSAAGENAQMGF